MGITQFYNYLKNRKKHITYVEHKICVVTEGLILFCNDYQELDDHIELIELTTSQKVIVFKNMVEYIIWND